MGGLLKPERLAMAIRDMIRVSLKATPKEVTFGHPCSHLIEEAARVSILPLATRLVEDPSGSEFRLNGAGLKMYIHKNYIGIGGDQETNYPDTVPKLKEVLEMYSLGRKRNV